MTSPDPPDRPPDRQVPRRPPPRRGASRPAPQGAPPSPPAPGDRRPPHRTGPGGSQPESGKKRVPTMAIVLVGAVLLIGAVAAGFTLMSLLPKLADPGAAEEGSAAGEILSGLGELASAEDRAAQARTMDDMSRVGQAAFSWLTDQVSAGAGAPPHAAGQTLGLARPAFAQGRPPIRVADYPPALSHASITEFLVPDYIREVPALDGWGNPYEFRLVFRMDAPAMMIRSAGADGAPDGSTYTEGAFPADELHHDIVWADGRFLRYPEGARRY